MSSPAADTSLSRPMPPATPVKGDDFVFDFIPRLKHLLPQLRGLPGYEYAQISTGNMKRAQAERWVEVDGTVVYTIRGPKGEIDMKLYVRGQRIPGQAHNSGRRRLLCDKAVSGATGLPIKPGDQMEETEGGEVEKQEAVASEQAGSEQRAAVPQDRQGEAGRPGAQQYSGGGKGRGRHQGRRR